MVFKKITGIHPKSIHDGLLQYVFNMCIITQLKWKYKQTAVRTTACLCEKLLVFDWLAKITYALWSAGATTATAGKEATPAT